MTWYATVISVMMIACAPGARSDHKTEPRGNMDTISALNEVCEILTRDPLSPAAARDALSHSGAAWVRTARVVAADGGDEPNHVELELPAPLARDALEQAFGVGREAPMLHPESPTEVLYYPAAPAGRHHTCAIIARVGGDGVRTVAVRRDPRV